MPYYSEVPTGDQESHHQKNLSAVLTHLRQNAPISRAAQADITGLARATITRLVRELMELDLVRKWEKTIQLIQQACAFAQKTNHQILGLGMSLPGLVDVQSGSLLFSGNLNWKDVPVRRWLTRQINFPDFQRYFIEGISFSGMGEDSTVIF